MRSRQSVAMVLIGRAVEVFIFLSADVEADPLGEREVSAVVDGVGSAAHVLLPRIGAGFAAASSLFFAAEGSAYLRA